MEYTQDQYLKYSKSKLNEAYLHDKMKQAIIKVMEGVNWSVRTDDAAESVQYQVSAEV